MRIRNRYISFLLLLLLVVTQTGSVLALLAFSGNREFIANELCVNRFEPALECNGQCQLMQSVERAQEGNSSDTNTRTVEDQVHLFFAEYYHFTPSFLRPVYMANFPMPDNYLFSYTAVFSPPPELV